MALHLDYDDFVRERLADGDDPNEITRGIEDALAKLAGDWTLFGDGCWRRNLVCSVCGDKMVALCGPTCTSDRDREIILRSEYMRRRGQT